MIDVRSVIQIRVCVVSVFICPEHALITRQHQKADSFFSRTNITTRENEYTVEIATRII